LSTGSSHGQDLSGRTSKVSSNAVEVPARTSSHLYNSLPGAVSRLQLDHLT